MYQPDGPPQTGEVEAVSSGRHSPRCPPTRGALASRARRSYAILLPLQMTLAPGTRIGVFEVVGKLGEGGMGEVYRARDTRLDRDVALKVLPALFTSDPDRLARFEREAKVLATLNHPNIAQVYGFEPPSTSSGQAAIAMELVEGRDLSEVIGALQPEGAPQSPGGLPLTAALAIARQMANTSFFAR